VTRAVLAFLIIAFALTLGLATAALQAQNHVRASELDKLKRECDRLEAEIQDLEAITMKQRFRLHHDYGAGRPTH
jgi:cell division protein FtsB